jgi:hypothetical protein
MHNRKSHSNNGIRSSMYLMHLANYHGAQVASNKLGCDCAVYTMLCSALSFMQYDSLNAYMTLHVDNIMHTVYACVWTHLPAGTGTHLSNASGYTIFIQMSCHNRPMAITVQYSHIRKTPQEIRRGSNNFYLHDPVIPLGLHDYPP